jgi:hypothetical protein
MGEVVFLMFCRVLCRGITAYKNVIVGIRVHGSANIVVEDAMVADSFMNVDYQNHSNGTLR